MKSLLKATTLSAIVFGLFSFSQGPAYDIKGKINVNSGTIYLKSFKNKMFFTIDSAKIRKGRFNFKGSVKQTDLYGLTLDRNESFRPYYIFIENCPINVEINTADRHSAKITGSVANDLFVSLESRIENSVEDLKIDSVIKVHPTSPVVAYILYREYAPELSASQLESDMALFDLSLYNLSYLKELRNIVAVKKRVEVGNQAIDFSGTTPDGKTIKLSDFYGNYLLLDFWASWCGPCRMENPNVLKAYNKFKANGFNVLGVSLDKDKDSWLTAIKKDSLTWNQISDLKFWDSAPARLYGIRGIPSNVLIDPSGKIIGRDLRGKELDKKLEEIYRKQAE